MSLSCLCPLLQLPAAVVLPSMGQLPKHDLLSSLQAQSEHVHHSWGGHDGHRTKNRWHLLGVDSYRIRLAGDAALRADNTEQVVVG